MGEEEEKRRKKERKRRSQICKLWGVWNLLRSVWKSINFFCTIVWICLVLGIEIIDIWFGTLYLVYGLGLETPKLISCQG